MSTCADVGSFIESKTLVVQTSNVGFTFEVPDYLVVHTGPGRVALTLNFLVAVVNTLNSSKEISEFFSKNANVKSISHCKQRMKSKLSPFFPECVKKKLCKPSSSFIRRLHSLRGMVRYRTLRVKVPISKSLLSPDHQKQGAVPSLLLLR